MELTIPVAMRPFVEQVLNGEYSFHYQGVDNPVILDIGANVGAFAIWAANKWSNSQIYCYEPLKSNYELLVHNTSQMRNSNIICENIAIGNSELTRLYKGKHNSGESSLFRIGEQTEEFEEIKTVSASLLPEASILKMDVEGSELDILQTLEKENKLKFSYILLEYHGDDTRREIDNLLKDYILIGGSIYRPHRGVLKYHLKSRS